MPNLLLVGGMGRVGIAGRNGIGIAIVNVDTQYLSQKRGPILGIPNGSVLIICATAISRRDVEKSVQSKTEPTAIVIGLRLVEAEDDFFRRGIGYVRRGSRTTHLKTRNLRMPPAPSAGCRVIHIEKAVIGIVRMKGQ